MDKSIREVKVLLYATSMLCLVFFSAMLSAQDDTLSDAQKAQQEGVEQIEVVGRAGDAALQAFAMGNFELAEIKFKENVACALRAERNLRAFADDARNAQLSQSITNGQQNSGPDQNASFPSTVTPSSNLQREQPLRDKTCTDRGYQVYMVGMSQLQLGRTEEAEQNFESAIRLNKHLHDAMYRLALMKLLREDLEGATEHFEDMQSLLKRCNNLCDAQKTLQQNIQFLDLALAGKIKLK